MILFDAPEESQGTERVSASNQILFPIFDMSATIDPCGGTTHVYLL